MHYWPGLHDVLDLQYLLQIRSSRLVEHRYHLQFAVPQNGFSKVTETSSAFTLLYDKCLERCYKTPLQNALPNVILCAHYEMTAL